MGQRYHLASESNRHNFNVYVDTLLKAGKKPVVEFVPERRSLPQNDLIHALYRQVAAQKEDESVLDITRECKLRYGVPILRRDSQQFRALYDKAIRNTLTYEEKLRAMDILPVTRLMGVEQAQEYIETVIREYSQQGLSLVHPSELEGVYG